MKTATWLTILGLAASSVDARSTAKMLVPAKPPGHDLLDLLHLEPQETQDLHFREKMGYCE